MRQGQHKNRSRNRGRRPSSSLNRVYESNGPDVKVRGTAQTVADKYQQLARDAASSGDIVKAESYYQHAEHYLRIVAANQPASQQPQQQRRSAYDDDAFDESEEATVDGEQASEEAQPQLQSSPDRAAESEQPQPAAVESEPQSSPDAAAEGEGKDGGNGFDGHQPDFLRRSAQPNGGGSSSSSPRPRRERRPRTPQPELAGSEQPHIPAAENSENTGENSGENN